MTVARRESEYDLYHVVSRGTGRQIIFEDDEDRRTYLRILTHAQGKTDVRLCAYCLMGNHVHLLLHAQLDKVSRCMRIVNGTYARYFNDKNGRTGHLFQERFRSEAIHDERYLMTVICYIHDNPRKARISSVEAYPWSSYQEYAFSSDTCETSLGLEVFGGREAYIEAQRSYEGMDHCLDVDSPRNATRPMSDEQAKSIADECLGGLRLNDLKGLPKRERDEHLRCLAKQGLSIRQIERLTGIGRGAVQRALVTNDLSTCHGDK